MLRLRVTYCGYGYAAKYGAKVYYMPIDLNILIHTLDGVRIPTSSFSISADEPGIAKGTTLNAGIRCRNSDPIQGVKEDVQVNWHVVNL